MKTRSLAWILLILVAAIPTLAQEEQEQTEPTPASVEEVGEAASAQEGVRAKSLDVPQGDRLGLPEGTPGDVVELPELEPGDLAWSTTLDDEITWFYPTSLGVVVTGSPSSLEAVDGITGRRLWSLPVVAPDPEAVLEVLQTNVLVVLRASDPKVLAAIGEGQTAPMFSLAVDLFSGDTLWRRDGAITEDPLAAIPVYEEAGLFLKTREPIRMGKMVGKAVGATLMRNFVPFGRKKAKKIATPNGSASMLDLLTGEYRWHRKVDDPANVKYYFYADRLAERKAENLHGLEIRQGEPVWKIGVEKKVLDVHEGALLLAEGRQLGSYDLEADTKKELKKGAYWQIKTPKNLEKIREVAAIGDKVYLAAQEGFAAVSLDEGDVVWAHALDERGKPASLVVSKDESLALGTLYHWDKRSKLRLVVIDTATGEEIARYPVERTPKGKPTFFEVSPEHSTRWLSEDMILIESDVADAAFRVAEGRLEPLWELERPLPPVFPEDEEMAERLKRKKRRIGILSLVGGIVLAGALGDVGSDIGQAMVLVASSAAVAAGLQMILESSRSVEQIAREMPDTFSKRALARFRARQERVDPYIKVDLMERADGEGHAVRRVDLRSGEILDETDLGARGRAEVDVAFSLVYQRPSDDHKTIQAYALPGYSPQVLQDFQFEM